MTARAFRDGVADLLLTDPTFTAAVAGLIGLPVDRVELAARKVSEIPSDRLPCWVIEQGDGIASSLSNSGDDQGLVIGLSEQQFASELYVTLVWSEQDRDRAADQRADLPTLIAQLFMRNPMPGGIAFAMLTEWVPDRGVMHPLQVWQSTLRGEYAIKQS